MPGWRENPYDVVLANLVQAMREVDEDLSRLAENVRPFDSKELTPEQDVLYFDNPSLHYRDEVEPTSGLPYANNQAAARLLAENGPEWYVNYVDDVVERADRRAREAMQP